ncbi:unnamed protein product [Cochlearia groenlandica]
MSKFTILPLCLVALSCLFTKSFSDQNDVVSSFDSPFLVKWNQRTKIVDTEFGEISAVEIGDGYNIQFITLEPNSVLLPLLLHSDMVLFVHTGTGILNWLDDEKERTLDLRQGDIFRLRSGSIFHIYSNMERDQTPEKLRVYAIFDVGKCLYEPCLGPYSNIRDLLLGFDDKTLRSAFAVSEELMGKIRDSSKPSLITNAMLRNRAHGLEEDMWQTRLVKLFVRVEDVTDHLEMKPVANSKKKKKKKSKAYNVFEADPDFENEYGQSKVVDEKDMDALKGSSIGVYMVNLTEGSMMGPHWNPSACEISVVLQGKGMISVVNHPSGQTESKSKSDRFLVEEGDVFFVPRFLPMSQLSFVNDSFLFMGFSTSAKRNYPQFLVGKSSVLQVIDREILAKSFDLTNETIERLLGSQKESVILECVACAEVELARLEKEIEERKRREEEEIERKRQEEEEREREEEEARKRKEEREREEEAAKKREEERKRRQEEEIERRRKEEEEVRKREEEREREEAAAKRREEERKRKEEEEIERKRKEEEEARKREEEREREEEAAKKREEERKRHEEEEIERKRKEEDEARKREEEREREEEEAMKREEERKRREEEEEAKKREEEREREEEAAKKREEERKQREEEEEEAKHREEEREREEAKRQEEERIRREKEKEAVKKREEEREKEEEIAKRREEERQRKEREEAEMKRREEQERKRREEQERKRREEEATKREDERKREEAAAERAEEERRRREEEEAKQRPPPQLLLTKKM